MPDMKKLGQHQFIGCKILLIGLYRIKGFTGNAACYYRSVPVCTDHDIDRNVRPAFLTGIGTDLLHCKTCPAYKLRVRKILPHQLPTNVELWRQYQNTADDYSMKQVAPAVRLMDILEEEKQ